MERRTEPRLMASTAIGALAFARGGFAQPEGKVNGYDMDASDDSCEVGDDVVKTHAEREGWTVLDVVGHTGAQRRDDGRRAPGNGQAEPQSVGLLARRFEPQGEIVGLGRLRHHNDGRERDRAAASRYRAPADQGVLRRRTLQEGRLCFGDAVQHGQHGPQQARAVLPRKPHGEARCGCPRRRHQRSVVARDPGLPILPGDRRRPPRRPLSPWETSRQNTPARAVSAGTNALRHGCVAGQFASLHVGLRSLGGIS